MSSRDQLDVEVLIVGGGPAGLAAAIKLRQLAKEYGRDELSVMLIEKALNIGDHGISGAVLDPRGLDELLLDWRTQAPLEAPVSSDAMWYMTAKGTFAVPSFAMPPMLKNRGKYVASLQKLTKWLGAVAEEQGADVLAAFPGQELLWSDDGRVSGVRVGDKGVDRNGNHKSNYEPGPDLHAKIVILAEGPCGTLAKQASLKLGLNAERDPLTYACGVKELWKCVPGRVQPGSVIHTFGFPLPNETFGGGFIYGMNDDILDIGMVTGLDYADPTTDPHDNLQRFKQHPAIAKLLEGATLLRYGAKAIPEGGLYAMPRAYANGLLIVGDSAGFLNGMRLKGIHLAIKSGILAAETAFTAIVAGACDAQTLGRYETLLKQSWAYDELRRARNFHQGFRHGLFAGMLNAALATYTGGRGFGIKDRLRGEAGFAQMKKLNERSPTAIGRRANIDNVLAFDKLTDVFHSGTRHDEDQVPHLHVSDTAICRDRCTAEYGNPCQWFCPAKVYDPIFAAKETNGTTTYEGRLQLDFSNCVHCKTCDIMDPYQIITWVPPQGGEGPVYTAM